MEAEQIYGVWAPPDALWSDWVAPALFAQIVCTEHETKLGEVDLSWFPKDLPERTAVVLDVPGAESFRLGAELAITRGFRPVPVINASPGPIDPQRIVWTAPSALDVCVVDMRGLVHTLCALTPKIGALALKEDAPPVFLLDNARARGERPADEGLFDNRWLVFPQDFPSAAFLQRHGIADVLLVQENSGQPQDDLAHVLLRWQEAGLRIRGRDGKPILVQRPSQFRALWYRALAILGLRRSSVGGFGSYIPGSSSSG